MFFKGQCKNRNIININKTNFSNKVSEDILHDTLKGGGSIAKPEGHLEIFPLSEGSDKSRFLDSIFHEQELVESGEYIYDREE